jgi:DNA-binding NarL/FixJ family response regulator
MHDPSFRHPVVSNVCRVLVAARDRWIRAAFRALLEADGRYVISAEACSGEEATALDRSLQPALILLDLLFPTTPAGLEVVRLLAVGNTRPIVVVSARAVLRDAALAAGAAGFVVQGEGTDVLLAVLAAAIAQSPPTSS